ncbi:MAG: CDP-alcohol phosphatidyltransferase family protein [Gammaproteobacteria bacterium]
MVTLYQIKPAFQGLLRPLTRALAAHGVSANQVTIAALLLSVAGGTLIASYPTARWPLLLLPPLLLLRMALNAIDGMLAREHDMKTALGALLNELGDVISDAALYLPLALVPGVSSLLVVVFTVLALVGEMTGVVAVQIGASRRYDGPLGKSDRALLLGALGLVLGLGVSPGAWLQIVLIVGCVLLVFTIVNRARRALAEAAP